MAESKMPFMVGMKEAIQDNLFTISSKKIEAVAQLFLRWLSHDAKLKPMDDAVRLRRLDDMGQKLRKMAKNLSVTFVNGKLVIKSDADSQSVLSSLRYGSDWFAPYPDVDAAIIVALASGSQVS